MRLADLVAASDGIAGTRSRLKKIEIIAGVLRLADPLEVPIVTSYLSGELRQRRTGVGWASLRDAPTPGLESTLTVSEVDQAFAEIESAAGSGSSARRRTALHDLFSRATAGEQRFMRGLISGELRQGALAGIMTEAIAAAWTIPGDTVRRATMLCGDLPTVASAAAVGGAEALAKFRLNVGTPVQPMLAQPAKSVDEALSRTGPASVEWKLDGIRVQVHKNGPDVEVFSRTLDRITDRVPELVAEIRALTAETVILDGETIAQTDDGRPLPFQVTGSRVASKSKSASRSSVPLTTFYFDILYADGLTLLDEPLSTRLAALDRAVPAAMRINRVETDDIERANEVSRVALSHGHEGVVVKALGSPYEAGRRGGSWIKVKPHHTLDLVILAVERGHGRRQGWLSNLHLGARDEASGEFVMLGKTFKGLTDAMLTWQTERLAKLATRDDGWTVHVRPEVVVEVAFDGVQTSPRYPAGMALRFARVVRYREDKRPEEADTVATVRAIHEGRL